MTPNRRGGWGPDPAQCQCLPDPVGQWAADGDADGHLECSARAGDLGTLSGD